MYVDTVSSRTEPWCDHLRPTEPVPIVAKHCGRGRQIGRIGPILTFANSDIKGRSCLGFNKSEVMQICCGISINDAKDEIDIHDLVMFYDEPSHPVQQ